jgi:hypothetical protein
VLAGRARRALFRWIFQRPYPLLLRRPLTVPVKKTRDEPVTILRLEA